MSDESNNLVLHYLRRIDEKFDRLIDDISDLRRRLNAVEERVVGITRRLDRRDVRRERVERRLDLIDLPVG
jgi:chromosome condensin MukBEF ATPase and DNA-binding subunit MukB